MAIYKNTSLVHQSNFVAAIDSYFYVFNTHLIKKNTATHEFKLFLTGTQKLQEVTCQPRSLGSFAFQKAWIWGQELTFKKWTKKDP